MTSTRTWRGSVYTFCPSAWADSVTVDTDDHRLLPHPPHPQPPSSPVSPLFSAGIAVDTGAAGCCSTLTPLSPVFSCSSDVGAFFGSSLGSIFEARVALLSSLCSTAEDLSPPVSTAVSGGESFSAFSMPFSSTCELLLGCLGGSAFVSSASFCIPSHSWFKFENTTWNTALPHGHSLHWQSHSRYHYRPWR